MKTIILGETKRGIVREIIDEVLFDEKLILAPVSISCSEKYGRSPTVTNFSFDEIESNSKNRISIKKAQGSGFVDCLFQGCMNQYVDNFRSLRNLVLEEFSINPSFSADGNLGSDASVEVILDTRVKGRDLVQFRNTSRSILLSSYANILSIFEFYINCERCFQKLRSLVYDAEKRSRGDISSELKHKLSFLTEVNSYDNE